MQHFETIQALKDWLNQNPDAPLHDIDLSNFTDLSYLFAYSERTVWQGIESWKVGHVVNMEGMFLNTPYFNADLNKWDVSHVKNMSYMFKETKQFTGGIEAWNVSNVVDMCSMFEKAEVFNCDLSAWDVSRVQDMSSMF